MDDYDLVKAALASGDPALMRQAVVIARDPLFHFRPRPDKPEQLDQQASFYHDQFAGLSCVLAGNGAGKSYAGAAKVARFLRDVPPPEPNTPFWILSKTMDMVSGCCWAQNLSHFIPRDRIAGCVWYRQARSLPRSVILRPHPNGNNYVIELKSYDQDRQALQAANIVGFWCDEQCPYGVLMECWARTRKWAYPGTALYTLTPLQPDAKLEEIYQQPPDSWKFYRFNTRLNDTLAPGFVDQISENEIGPLVETRLTGAFARFEGAVYPEFSPTVHVIDPIELPPQWLRIRGLDLGWSHATACVWAARDLEGRYFVYREYLQTKTSVEDHVMAINDDWSQNPNRGHTYADPAAAQTLHEFALRGLQTTPANKDVLAGIATVQSLLRPGQDGRPKLFIFKNCKELIREMRSYVWDSKKQDKPLKVNDHLCFVAGTMVSTGDGERPIESILPGDLVLTRQGLRRVLASGCTGTAPVRTITTEDGRTLTGTANHPVWTLRNGWTPIQNVTQGDYLIACNNAQSQTSSSSTASSSGDTRTPGTSATDATSCRTSPTSGRACRRCTKRYGRPHMAPYQRDTSSTTRTVTHSTTASTTSNASAKPNTWPNTGGAAITPLTGCDSTSTLCVTSPQSGTGARQGENGTKATANEAGSIGSPPREHVSNAGLFTKPETAKASQSIAATIANRQHGGRPESIMNPDSVPSAGQSFAATSIPGNYAAPVCVVANCPGNDERVYNLTVEEAHEYYANGLLVHNCDATRYMAHSHRMDSTLEVRPLKQPERKKVNF